MGRGNESLFAASGSHDQDDRQTHTWFSLNVFIAYIKQGVGPQVFSTLVTALLKTFNNILQNQRTDFHEIRNAALGTRTFYSLFK